MISRRTKVRLFRVKSRYRRLFSDDPFKLVGQGRHFAGQRHQHDHLFAGIHQVAEVNLRPHEMGVDPIHGPVVAGIHEKSVHHVEEVVPGRPVNRPVPAEASPSPRIFSATT